MRSFLPDLISPGVRQSLSRFGRDVALARRKRHFTVEMMAEWTGLAKSTYRQVERGDAGVAMGAYAMTLFVLGFGGALEGLVAVRRRDADPAPDGFGSPKRAPAKRAPVRQDAAPPAAEPELAGTPQLASGPGILGYRP